MPIYSEFLIVILAIVTGTVLGLTPKKSDFKEAEILINDSLGWLVFLLYWKSSANAWIPQSLLKKMKSSSPRPQCGEIN